ncbi:response regulator receiver domain-containing protein [Limimaricola soesokkakensis]|uniref:Putative transcriptional regulatory protein pdtaR n=1 Tax=Limimaricola soesokkakensis TaxID=1343159 RepID=A0A1X6Z2R9_9RHOB|nr:response regulator [Limimaricola soesokkakensis]PSK81801.1 response regulator receiver domain-containing protein [Limimaricola soesokkakensis]SLN38822.1 putative transcriptional regulatory protein pdtaR [Limimaricola soesokkakensis]
MRVLIVEDEVFIAMDLEVQLIDMGQQVTGIAVSKATALEMARADRPDLALVDLRLSGPSSGIEAAAIMRVELGIPIVLVSGSLHELTDDDLAEIAPIALLGKPYSPTNLAAVLAKAEGDLGK